MQIPDGYTTFENDTEKLLKYKKWKLLSKTQSSVHPLVYKGIYSKFTDTCNIIGYYNDRELLIELLSSNKKVVIARDYLKQMQQKSFNRCQQIGED